MNMPQWGQDQLQRILTSIHEGWSGVKEAILSINPVPEAIRPIIGSRYFWFVVWIATLSGLGRNLLGDRIGPWLGLFAGGASWYLIVANPWHELTILVVILVCSPFLSSILSNNKVGRQLRGVKICPECAEEVKSKARVCKHCTHRF